MRDDRNKEAISESEVNILIGNKSLISTYPSVAAEVPFAPKRMQFLECMSKYLMEDQEASHYPDIITFAFWIRKGHLHELQTKFASGKEYRSGRGILFHIAPSNVPVMFAYSFAVGFLTGNINIIRLSSTYFRQTEILLRPITYTMNCCSDYEEAIYFIQYHHSTRINNYFSALCDVRIVWGGDRTIEELRKSPLRPRAREVNFADRYSICIIEAEEYLSCSQKEQLATGFYNDTYLMDQNACSSPRAVFWIGEEKDVEKAGLMFWKHLHDIVKEKYAIEAISSVKKLETFLHHPAIWKG